MHAKFIRFQASNALNGPQFPATAETLVRGSSAAVLAGFDPSPLPADTACTPAGGRVRPPAERALRMRQPLHGDTLYSLSGGIGYVPMFMPLQL
ncbi:hypothetical protein [Arthrobacter sp. UYEF3]|uniref:hypothetical protein n=1 Tax=Arthrobacter sp. UYEF3 TaxID=1756365 RepID=UPI00339719DA